MGLVERGAQDGCPDPRHLEVFRQERVEEPLELYLEKFESFRAVVEDLLEESVDLSLLRSTRGTFLTTKDRLRAIRYLASPAISEDDLKTVADVPSLAIGRLHSNPERAKRIITQALETIDRNRFAWMGEDRTPTEAERPAAVAPHRGADCEISAGKMSFPRRAIGLGESSHANTPRSHVEW